MAFDGFLTPMNNRIAPTAVITAAGALSTYDLALTLGTPDAYQRAADQLAEVVRRAAASKIKTPAELKQAMGFPADYAAAPRPKRARKAETTSAGVFNAQNLRAALTRLIRALPPGKFAIPILKCVYLIAGEGKVRLVATDLDQQITEVLTDYDGEPVTAVVDCKDLATILKGHTGGVSLAGVPDGTLIVNAGGVTSHLPGLLEGDFPVMPEPSWRAHIRMEAPDLVQSLGFVADAMSTEETRYYLNGTLFQSAGDRLSLVATNGHMLKVDATDTVEMIGDRDLLQGGLIVPRLAVLFATKALDRVTDNVTLNFSNQHFGFTSGSTTYLTKIVDGSYPQYQQVIPRNPAPYMTIGDADAVCDTLVSVTRGFIKQTPIVRFSQEEGGVKVSAKPADKGMLQAMVPTARSTAKFDIGFDQRYLHRAFRGHDRVAVHVDKADDPTLVVYADHPRRLTVLMPVRL